MPEDTSPILDIRGLCAGYGRSQVLHDIRLTVGAGELIAVVGANGAGKTTLLRTISGLIVPTSGEIHHEGERIDRKNAPQIAARGILHVPENRHIFPDQTTEDNLLLGAYMRMRQHNKQAIREEIEALLVRFPNLGHRRKSLAGVLSGGEQQMLAIARALIGKPKLLMLDEPSVGLAPAVTEQVFEILVEERRKGMTILLVVQLAYQALSIADRGYVLSHGAIVMEGKGEALISQAGIQRAYLGTQPDAVV
jgi:branched-chain amino acid transport system ATP-binding protein